MRGQLVGDDDVGAAQLAIQQGDGALVVAGDPRLEVFDGLEVGKAPAPRLLPRRLAEPQRAAQEPLTVEGQAPVVEPVETGVPALAFAQDVMHFCWTVVVVLVIAGDEHDAPPFRAQRRDRREQACTDSDVAGEDQHLVRVGRQRPHEAGPAVVVELEVQVGQDSQAHSWEESMSGHSCNAQRQRDQAEERILGEVHVLQRKAA